MNKQGKRGPDKADETQVLSGNRTTVVLRKARFSVVKGRDAGKELVLQKGPCHDRHASRRTTSC